jgi:hypothetical protein
MSEAPNDVKSVNPYGLLPRGKNTPTLEASLQHLQSAQAHLSASDAAVKVTSDDAHKANETLWSDVLSMNATVTVLSRLRAAAATSPAEAKEANCKYPDLIGASSIDSFCVHFGHFYRLFCYGKQPVRMHFICASLTIRCA